MSMEAGRGGARYTCDQINPLTTPGVAGHGFGACTMSVVDPVHRLHLDTDFGGDPDDLCALALALAWPETQITGITTVADRHGLRAGYVRHVLELAERSEIRVEAGAKVSLTDHKQADPVQDDARYFPPTTPPLVSEPYASIELTERSMFKSATFLCIGPLTNAAMFDRTRSGLLRHKRLVFLGGQLGMPGAGDPAWSPEMDFTVQWDTRATEELMKTWADLTMVPLGPTQRVPLTEADCRKLDRMGAVGRLIARQLRAWGVDHAMPALGQAHVALPGELLGFAAAPVAVAVALGWPGATIEPMTVMPSIENGVISWERADDGRAMRVVTDIDGAAFRELFLARIATLP